MFPLRKAREIVEKAVLEKLAPHCERIDIVGSIRREVFEVKDGEICVVAKKIPEGIPDLFGETKLSYKIVPAFSKAIGELGKHIKGFPSERYVQIMLHEKIKLDIFIPQEIDYFRQLAIRTGSWKYSNQTIAGAWVRKGWRGTDKGLRLEEQCKGTPYLDKKSGETKMKWECIAINPTLPPVWQSEEDFFSWLDIQWLPPKHRTI